MSFNLFFLDHGMPMWLSIAFSGMAYMIGGVILGCLWISAASRHKCSPYVDTCPCDLLRAGAYMAPILWPVVVVVRAVIFVARVTFGSAFKGLNALYKKVEERKERRSA